MPVPTSSRQHRYFSPPTIATTPSRANHGRTPSINASSYSPTITPAGQTKLNVVTRVAVEGKAKHGQDGVSIRMYLKISLPLDSVAPGQTIPLFPEGSVKVLTSQVHPLNHKSVPYNFSSTISPMLNTAAKALNLPARSMESFHSVFHLPPSPETSTTTGTTRTLRTNGNASSSEIIPPVDVHYTGHILVSHYSVSFVLPKVFPSVDTDDRLSDNEENEGIPSRSRVSIGEKNYAQFMAAIDMWVPFVSKPPRAPYLLSIPTPRCLHNHIKLRIFPPSNASASFASLSSVEEDVNYWHLTSDPHVTRNAPSRPSRTQSITHFADDETSDSSATGFADGCGIQGTFPSTENIRIRWAKPLKTIDVSGGGQDSRRRVGVNDVKGEMVCIIRGKMKDPENSNAEGLIVSLEYKGTCKGVWFPGVATLLGMDVSLEAKGSELSWVSGSPSEWTINGGTGYTGFNVGPLQNAALLEFHLPKVVDPSPKKNEEVSRLEGGTSRATSSSSLLRAPLPVQTVADYSFEGSAITASSSMSLSSTSVRQPEQIHPPNSPITLHINVNEFLPPAKNIFTFTISGTVLISPKSNRMNSRPGSSSTPPLDDLSDPPPLVIPRFTVLAADSESTSFIIRNEVDSIAANLEVYNLTGDIYRDAQTRKTVLQKGGFTRCGEDGGRIGLKSIVGANDIVHPLITSRSRAPNGNILPRALSNQSLRKRDSPLLLSSVLAVVTPFQTDNKEQIAYAVRIRLSNTVSGDTGHFEFGLAQPSPSFGVPNVLISGVSIGGVPIKFESIASFQHQQDPASAPSAPFEDIRAKKWVSWVKAHVVSSDDGEVVVDYVVSGDAYPTFHQRKGKRRARDDVDLQVLLPTFSVPVGRLEVNVDPMSGLDVVLRSNLRHRQDSRLLHYSMEEHFDPQLTLTLRRTSIAQTSSLTVFRWLLIITWLFFFLGIVGNFHLRSEVKELKLYLETVSNSIASEWNDGRTQPPVTITTTVYGTGTSSRWWFGEATVDSNTFTSAPSPSPSPFVASSPSPLTSIVLNSELPQEKPDFDVHELNSNAISLAPDKFHWEIYSLFPFQRIPSWPNEDIHNALRNFFSTMETIWKLFKKVYHYPLDPP